MRKETDIMVLGDVHGFWGDLNNLVNKQKPSVILQAGDFGYFPRFDEQNPKASIKNVKPKDSKIYWCDGNHEDHWTLRDRYNNRGENIIAPNIYYMPRGEVLTLPDGRVAMFIGGADSIDKAQRIVGHDWFPEEIINQGNIDDCLAYKGKVDIIISHTCPTYFDIQARKQWLEGRGRDLQGFRYRKDTDPSRKALDIIYDHFKPSLWYFAHWHIWTGGTYENTKWTCLNMLPNTGAWEWLPKRGIE